MAVVPVEEDPQIHGLALGFKAKVRTIYSAIVNKQYNVETNQEILMKCINFFVRYVKYLPECNDEIINLCRSCLILLETSASKLGFGIICKLIIICVTMIISRKDELILREVSSILHDILKYIPPDVLKTAVRKHVYMVKFLFQKIFFVQTYYTQMAILRALFLLTRDLREERIEVIKKHQIMLTNKEVLDDALEALNEVNLDNMITSSRSFLNFANVHIAKKLHIYSCEGFIFSLNGSRLHKTEYVYIDFNGRSLTISFFISDAVFNEDLSESQSESISCIELDYSDIDAEETHFKNSDVLKLSVVVKNAVITENYDCVPRNLPDLKKMVIIMTDQSANAVFMQHIYEKFKLKDKFVVSDGNSFHDLESLQSYRTCNTNIFNECANFQNNSVQQSQVKIEGQKNNASLYRNNTLQSQQVNNKDVQKKQVENRSQMKIDEKNAKNKQVPVKKEVVEKKTRGRKPKGQVKKGNQENLYDDVPQAEKLPSFRTYMSQKRDDRKSKALTQTNQSSENESGMEGPPIRKVQNVSKNIHFDTDSDDDDDQLYDAIKKIKRRGSKKSNATIAVKPKLAKNNNLSQQPKAKPPAAAANKGKRNLRSSKKTEITYDYNMLSTKPLLSKFIEDAMIKGDETQKDINSINGVDENMNRMYIDDFDALINPEEATQHPVAEITKKQVEKPVKEVTEKKVTICEDAGKKSKRKSFEYTAQENPSPLKKVKTQNHNAAVRKPLHQLNNIAVENNVQKKNCDVKMCENNENTKNAHMESNANDQMSSSYLSDADVVMEDCKQFTQEEIVRMKNEWPVFDPCEKFEQESSKEAKKLRDEMEKIQNELNDQIKQKYREPFDRAMAENCGKRAVIKDHVNFMVQLQNRYDQAAAKLATLMEEKELLDSKVLHILKKRDQELQHKKVKLRTQMLQIREKAIETQDTLMTRIWHTYLDENQKELNKSVKKLYEI